MNTATIKGRGRSGYVSYVMVLSLGITMLVMLINSYRTSIRSHDTQRDVSLRVDYEMKEDAVLRAIVPITANRAMMCMKDQSNSGNNSYELRWQRIFRAAIDQAMGSESIENKTLKQFGLEDSIVGNPGDATIYSSNTFWAYHTYNRPSYATPGINQDFGAGFPPPLESVTSQVNDNDDVWPIISTKKYYGSLASERVGAPVAEYPQFNLIPYPQIRFGYANPGQPFVAKRNWWAFKMDLAAHQRNRTELAKRERDFVISIYEVPSQLAISAEAFTVLGQHADGSQWQDFTIQGGVYSSRAKIAPGMALERLSGRHAVELQGDATVGDNPLFAAGEAVTNPFTPGVRERYELDHGSFMPVSLASESGRAAFVPINRGVEFFDRYAHDPETNTVSPTTWNEYSVGALQCAMNLDITDVPDADTAFPSELTFRYFKNGLREELVIDLGEGPDAGLPPGYIYCADEHDTVFFEYPVDVAYGKNGSYYYEEGVTGNVSFNNARFGDPLVGTFKAGYYRPSYPFEVVLLHETRPCVKVYPERFANFLGQLGADGPEVNHSISINVDYQGSAYLQKPSIPCTDLDYGVILDECADLTTFTRGFSMVTNLRLYLADDFNTVGTTPPAGSGLASPFYPPASLFAPEKRYGAEYNPFRLKITGQMGSLAGGREDSSQSVHLLDLKNAAELEMDHDKIEVNLSPIEHPAALPPVMMMNWLVVLEERRSDHYDSASGTP
ncbi:hypothetical protein [Haloferula sp. A504]|uniref:hypothetical protein n=1 Tax=Haloferula sp. A504 TaxID=3373601 RepID=UPI0031CB165F|nr:hypothetical protein [Verrucomicrobiaceae bacterium E54]